MDNTTVAKKRKLSFFKKVIFPYPEKIVKSDKSGNILVEWSDESRTWEKAEFVREYSHLRRYIPTYIA
jgi:hypothetical protein